VEDSTKICPGSYEDYVQYRFASIRYLGEHISPAGVPIAQPPGGHASRIEVPLGSMQGLRNTAFKKGGYLSEI